MDWLAFFKKILCAFLSFTMAMPLSILIGVVLPAMAEAQTVVALPPLCSNCPSTPSTPNPRDPVPLTDAQVKSQAGDGQGEGMNLFSKGRNLPSTQRNYTNDTAHKTGCATAGGCNASTHQEIYVEDFAPGDELSSSSMANYAANPDLINPNSKERRNNLRDRNCRTTSFQPTPGQSGVVVLRGKVVERVFTRSTDPNPPYKIISTKTDVPAAYTGPININFSTIGGGRIDEVVLRPVTATTPALILIYEKTPFAKSGNTNFTYNHQVTAISGTLTGTLTSYGNPTDGYKTVASITGTNISEFVVTADLYDIVRTYTPPPAIGSCPVDPVGCVLSGINFCAGTAGAGIADVFLQASDLTASGGIKAGKVKTDIVVENMMLDGAAYPKPTVINSPDLAVMAASSDAIVDGTHSVFSEVFTGCREETTSTNYYQSTHHPLIKSCVAVPMNPDAAGCSAQRLDAFTKISNQAAVVRGSFYPLIAGMPGPSKVAWSGTINLNLRTVGTPVSGNQIPVDANTVLIVDYNTPIVDPNENVSTNHNVTVVGASGSGSSTYYGKPSDSYTSTVTLSGTGMTDFTLYADLYYKALHGFSGCASRLTASSDGFCSKPATCDQLINSYAGMPLTGAGAGALDVLEAWGRNPSGSFELAPKNCWKITAGPDICSTIAYDQNASSYSNSLGLPGFIDNCVYRGANTSGTCQLVSRNTCQPSLLGPVSGTCYGYDVKYDCGFDANSTAAGSAQQTIKQCSAAIRCMGTECANTKIEVNNDYGQTAASAQMVQYMKYDFKCAESGNRPVDTNSPCTPIIFEGKNLQCGMPQGSGIGIMQNCCEQGDTAAAGANPLAMVWVFSQLYSVVDKQMMVKAASQVPGYTPLVDAYDAMATKATEAVSTVTQPLANAFTNFVKDMGWDITKKASVQAGENAAVSGGSGASSTILGDLSSEIGYQLAEATEAALNAIYPGAGTAVESAAASIMASESAKMIAQGFNVLMWAYTAYQVAQIVGTLAYPCSEDELMLGLEKAHRQCHYVGTYCAQRVSKAHLTGAVIVAPYMAAAIAAGATEGTCIEEKESHCCFASPLARIIAEQLRMQDVGGNLGGGWNESDPEHANCKGFTVDHLTAADWSRVKLKEWTDMLMAAGVIANDVAKADTLYDPNRDPALNRIGKPSFGPDGPQTAKTIIINSFGDAAPVPTSGDYTSTTRVGVNRENREYLESQKVCYASGQKSMAWYGTANIRPEDVITEMGGAGGFMTPCTSPAPNQACMDIVLPVLLPGDAWTGAALNNNLPENCTTGFSSEYNLYINRPDLIVSASMEEVQFDDHLQVSLNESPVWTSSQYYNPASCEQGVHWCMGNLIFPPPPSESCTPEAVPAPVDVTSYFKQFGQIKAKVNVRVGDRGEGLARIRVLYSVPVNGPGGSDCVDPAAP